MTETPPEDPQKPTLMARGKKAMETADRAGSIAESASTAFGAIKWVAIAIVTLTLAGGIYGVYNVISAPAKAVGNAAGAVTESVKSGTDKIKQGGADVINRLDITTTNQATLNRAAEAAFESLNTMMASEPESMKNRIYRRTHFGGHENQICSLEVKTGSVSIPVTLAADNEAHATAKALGAKDNRLIRMILTAGKEELALHTEWDENTQNWIMRWKATTLKKEIGDDVAEDRIMDVLVAAARECR